MPLPVAMTQEGQEQCYDKSSVEDRHVLDIPNPVDPCRDS